MSPFAYLALTRPESLPARVLACLAIALRRYSKPPSPSTNHDSRPWPGTGAGVCTTLRLQQLLASTVPSDVYMEYEEPLYCMVSVTDEGN